MYKLHFLKKENDLNKLIKLQKKNKSNMTILFTSLWDNYCEKLVEDVKEKYSDVEEGAPLYIVDSFHMPHSFVIYDTTKLPQVVKLSRKGPQSEDYLPNVRSVLGV